MPKLEDILADSKTYPDDQQITLADGVTVTLKDLRSGYRDYRDKASAVARQREQLERDYQERMTALQTAEARLMELAKDVVARQPATATQDDLTDAVAADPAVGRVMNEISQMKQALGYVVAGLKAMDDRFQHNTMAQIQAQHKLMLAHLKKQDPDLNEEELITYAQQHMTPRLDVAYAAMTRDKAIEAATRKAMEEGEKKGYEKARTELLAPQLPLRRSQAVSSGTPSSLDEAVDKALQDPDVLKPLVGGV